MLGGHFMEAVPLGGQMDCFVGMACRNYFHLELFDCHVDTLTLLHFPSKISFITLEMDCWS